LADDGNEKTSKPFSVKLLSLTSGPKGLMVTVVVYGPLSDVSSGGYHIDLFANPVADPSGFVEGKVYLGSAAVTPSPGGHVFTVTVPLPKSGLKGTFTATATDLSNDTSEFSTPLVGLK
jgi:hypothetical protein